MPLPGAAIWKGVAEALTHGLGSLHISAQLAALIGAILGIVIEIVSKRTKGRFPLSGVGLGLGMVLQTFRCPLNGFRNFIFLSRS